MAFQQDAFQNDSFQIGLNGPKYTNMIIPHGIVLSGSIGLLKDYCLTSPLSSTLANVIGRLSYTSAFVPSSPHYNFLDTSGVGRTDPATDTLSTTAPNARAAKQRLPYRRGYWGVGDWYLHFHWRIDTSANAGNLISANLYYKVWKQDSAGSPTYTLITPTGGSPSDWVLADSQTSVGASTDYVNTVSFTPVIGGGDTNVRLNVERVIVEFMVEIKAILTVSGTSTVDLRHNIPTLTNETWLETTPFISHMWLNPDTQK